MAEVDIITVFHNQANLALARGLVEAVERVEPGRCTVTLVDNTVENRGFARGCNFGAAGGLLPVLGFLNPDVEVLGPFLDQVLASLSRPDVAITGARFGKPDHELESWGVTEWVCGAALFVRRDLFEALGGFDERFVWGWEETDLIRRVQAIGRRVEALPLPLRHESPSVQSGPDVVYKGHHLARGWELYQQKWPR